MLLVEGNGHDDRGECASAIANWNCPLEGGRTVPLSCHPLSACKCMYICKICQLMSQAASSIYIIGFTHAGTPKVRDDISRHMPSGSALPRTVRPASLDYGCSGDFSWTRSRTTRMPLCRAAMRKAYARMYHVTVSPHTHAVGAGAYRALLDVVVKNVDASAVVLGRAGGPIRGRAAVKAAAATARRRQRWRRRRRR